MAGLTGRGSAMHSGYLVLVKHNGQARAARVALVGRVNRLTPVVVWQD